MNRKDLMKLSKTILVDRILETSATEATMSLLNARLDKAKVEYRKLQVQIRDLNPTNTQKAKRVLTGVALDASNAVKARASRIGEAMAIAKAAAIAGGKAVKVVITE